LFSERSEVKSATHYQVDLTGMAEQVRLSIPPQYQLELIGGPVQL
jgi:hypothetical protein